jgi:hypothetical protein
MGFVPDKYTLVISTSRLSILRRRFHYASLTLDGIRATSRMLAGYKSVLGADWQPNTALFLSV